MIRKLGHYISQPSSTSLPLTQIGESNSVDPIQELLRSNPVFDGIVPNDYKCSICKNVMYKATFIQCGCESCNDCLIEYLSETKSANNSNNSSKFCHGTGSDCGKVAITLNDLQINPVTNRKIAQLCVKCKYKGCDFIAKLNEIIEHQNQCVHSYIPCPLSEFGCDSDQMLKSDNLSQHLTNNLEMHFSLIAVKFNKLQAENNLLKELFNQVSNENKQLVMDIKELKSKSSTLSTYSIKQQNMKPIKKISTIAPPSKSKPVFYPIDNINRLDQCETCIRGEFIQLNDEFTVALDLTKLPKDNLQISLYLFRDSHSTIGLSSTPLSIAVNLMCQSNSSHPINIFTGTLFTFKELNDTNKLDKTLNRSFSNIFNNPLTNSNNRLVFKLNLD